MRREVFQVLSWGPPFTGQKNLQNDHFYIRDFVKSITLIVLRSSLWRATPWRPVSLDEFFGIPYFGVGLPMSKLNFAHNRVFLRNVEIREHQIRMIPGYLSMTLRGYVKGPGKTLAPKQPCEEKSSRCFRGVPPLQDKKTFKMIIFT